MIMIITFLALSFIVTNLFGQKSFESELIFPFQTHHVHSSGIVELPNGDFLVSIFNLVSNFECDMICRFWEIFYDWLATPKDYVTWGVGKFIIILVGKQGPT